MLPNLQSPTSVYLLQVPQTKDVLEQIAGLLVIASAIVLLSEAF